MTGLYLQAYSRAAAVGALREWFPFRQFPWTEEHVGSGYTSLYIRGGILTIHVRSLNDPRPGYAITLDGLIPEES